MAAAPRYSRVLFFALAGVLLSACAAGEASQSAPPATPVGSVSASGSGQSNTINASDLPMPAAMSPTLAVNAPQRIVSLATGAGETLAALGVGNRVVGRDETSNVPEIAGAPVVTKAHSVSAEKVLATNPDLVVIDKQTNPPEAIDRIRSAGVPVVSIPEAWTLADIGPRTAAIAKAVGIQNFDTDAYLAGLKLTAAPTPNGVKVAFLYLRGTSAIYLLGGKGSGADALIQATGGTDVGAEAGLAAFTPLTAEGLVSLNPDVILVMTKGLESVGGVDGLTALPGVAQTTAGKNKAVVAVDDNALLSFGPRTGELVARLTQAFAGFAR